MNPLLSDGLSILLNAWPASIDHVGRSPLTNGPMSGTPLEGLFAAALVLIFMTVALLKPEWMG